MTEPEYKIKMSIYNRIETIENDEYSWTSFNETRIYDKEKQTNIYQGNYIDRDAVGCDRKSPNASYREFWDVVFKLLKEEEDARRKKNDEAMEIFDRTEAESRGPGWCDHCGSYCYGDCQC